MNTITPLIILKTLKEIRVESKIASKQLPKIEYTLLDSDNNVLYVIVNDRVDRSSLIGYGGLIIRGLKRKLGIKELNVIAKTDLLVKRKRISNTIRKAKYILKKRSINDDAKEFLKILIEQLELEKHFPPRVIIKNEGAKNIKIIVAYSGGVDSTATLVILKKMGFNVEAVTVDPGPYIVPEHVRETIINVLEKLQVKHVFIKPIANYDDVVREAHKGFSMPCSLCYPIMANTIYDYALERKVHIVAFGDIISTSSYTIDFPFRKSVMRVNIPSAFALTKYDTVKLSQEAGIKLWKPVYGCPLLRYSMKKHRWMRLIAIERILRETRAGVLEPMVALRYIKSILKLGKPM